MESGGCRMSYQNSINLLPKELLEQVQKYVEGKVIYIPKKKANKKHWGENTDTKELLASRNHQMYLDFQNGMSVQRLSEKYFLTTKSIQRIIKQNNI
ncbi:MAG: hypothetical protein RHS_1146 [Robinsoniella sp. RHS]|nr:MAG: hypothetical protein RHS_1146 [Robinsoniella sp. RHS]